MKTLLSLAICPILKDLYVHRNRHEDDNVKKFTVKVPSLETLECVKEGLIVLNEEGVEDFGGYFVMYRFHDFLKKNLYNRCFPKLFLK